MSPASAAGAVAKTGTEQHHSAKEDGGLRMSQQAAGTCCAGSDAGGRWSGAALQVAEGLG